MQNTIDNLNQKLESVEQEKIKFLEENELLKQQNHPVQDANTKSLVASKPVKSFAISQTSSKRDKQRDEKHVNTSIATNDFVIKSKSQLECTVNNSCKTCWGLVDV